MALNTDDFDRCIRALEASIEYYESAPADSTMQEVFRNGVSKSYELAQEVAFKLLRKSLRDFGYTPNTLRSKTVKEILRLGAEHDLLTLDEVERWFEYRDNRNNTAHDYGVHFVEKTLTLLPRFIIDARSLCKAIQGVK